MNLKNLFTDTVHFKRYSCFIFVSPFCSVISQVIYCLLKAVAAKMKSTMPYGHWEEDKDDTSSDRQHLLERAAEERHQKIQELKEVEFEQQMLVEREQRIQQIESDMIDVNQIMKELSAMVHEQGEHISIYTNMVEVL